MDKPWFQVFLLINCQHGRLKREQNLQNSWKKLRNICIGIDGPVVKKTFRLRRGRRLIMHCWSSVSVSLPLHQCVISSCKKKYLQKRIAFFIRLKHKTLAQSNEILLAISWRFPVYTLHEVSGSTLKPKTSILIIKFACSHFPHFKNNINEAVWIVK